MPLIWSSPKFCHLVKFGQANILLSGKELLFQVHLKSISFIFCVKQSLNSPVVLRCSVVKCLTRNPGVLGSSCTGSSRFFHGSVLGQDTSELQSSTGETQERHERAVTMI